MVTNELSHSTETDKYLCSVGVTSNSAKTLHEMNKFLPPIHFQKYSYAKLVEFTACQKCVLRFVYDDIRPHMHQENALNSIYMDNSFNNNNNNTHKARKWYWLTRKIMKRIVYIVRDVNDTQKFHNCTRHGKRSNNSIAVDEKSPKLPCHSSIVPTPLADIAENLTFRQFCKQVNNVDFENDEITTKMREWWVQGKVTLSQADLNSYNIRKIPKEIPFTMEQMSSGENKYVMEPHVFDEMIMQRHNGPSCKSIQQQFIKFKQIVYMYLEYDEQRRTIGTAK